MTTTDGRKIWKTKGRSRMGGEVRQNPNKPLPFFVEYEEEEGEWYEEEFTTLADARRFAKTVLGFVYQRTNLRDVTPAGDPRGLLWEWDVVEEGTK